MERTVAVAALTLLVARLPRLCSLFWLDSYLATWARNLARPSEQFTGSGLWDRSSTSSMCIIQ